MASKKQSCHNNYFDGNNNNHYNMKDDENHYEQKDDLRQFNFSEPLSHPTDSPISLPLNEEKVLAKVEVCLKGKGDVTWLAATVGWRSPDIETDDDLTVEFRIRKGSVNGEIIFATRDGVGVDLGELRGQTTTFIHVDTSRSTCDETKYILTAELINADLPVEQAEVIGPIVFTAAVIN
jgi:hypothetical protein